MREVSTHKFGPLTWGVQPDWMVGIIIASDGIGISFFGWYIRVEWKEDN